MIVWLGYVCSYTQTWGNDSAEEAQTQVNFSCQEKGEKKQSSWDGVRTVH